MHTIKIDGFVFHHNGDYSGDVTIINADKKEISMPFITLKAFVAGYVKSRKISELENVEDDKILGV